MKRFATLALAAILALSAVSCGGGEAEPAGTAAETTVETTAAETTAEAEDAVRTELILDEDHAALPVYESSLDISDDSTNVFARLMQEYNDNGDAPSMYVVIFPEAPNLALVCETFEESGSISNRIRTVYFDGYRYDKDIFMLAGTFLTLEYTENVLAVVEQGGTMPGKGVLICANGVKEFDPYVDYCLFPEAVNGEMTYRLMTNKGCWLGISGSAVLDMNGDDIYEITGRAAATDEGIVLDEMARITMDDLFWSEEWRQVREENGLGSFEEYKEYALGEIEKMDEEFGENITEGN